jgi:hypothetical protein
MREQQEVTSNSTSAQEPWMMKAVGLSLTCVTPFSNVSIRCGGPDYQLVNRWPTHITNLGGPLFIEVVEEKGILMIAAAGNDGSNVPVYLRQRTVDSKIWHGMDSRGNQSWNPLESECDLLTT